MKKADKYCPIDKVPTVEITEDMVGEKRIARNVYISSRGYLVKYWNEGALHEKRFTSRDDILKEYGLSES